MGGEALGIALESVGGGRELGEVASPDGGRIAAVELDRNELWLDELAARNLLDYLAEEQSVTGALPTDRTVVVQRFRDELGDWRICLLTPFGARVHAPWALAIEARLRERLGQAAETLSGGEQQMLAMGRALMSHPRILLLDEPSMGLAPNLVEAIFDKIMSIHAEGTAILLVEQNANMALEVADRGYILQTGNIVLADSSAALRDNDDVKRAYLGA